MSGGYVSTRVYVHGVSVQGVSVQGGLGLSPPWFILDRGVWTYVYPLKPKKLNPLV